jgi:hypothetical protein
MRKTVLTVCVFGLIAAAAWGQCPTGTSYPSAVDTGATLTVAANNLFTTLKAPMQATDTVAVVSSSAGWTANMMATIDVGANTEMVYVTAVSGNVLTISRACEIPGGGYSATALAHALGAPVVQNATAYSGHTSVVGALEAIENALGPNLSHVSASGLIMSASSYNFPAYSCASSLVCAPGGPSGGALIAGNNTLTFTPIPNGVNGTDTNHKLSVSGGTGTAEACLITGGSGTSGETNGQIILQCAYSHSGAFTIQSATNGGQEAMEILKTAGTGGTIQYPAGVLSNCGTFTVDTDGITIAGTGSAGNGPIQGGSPGQAGTIIQPCSASQTLFSVPSGHTGDSTVARLSMHDLGFSNNGLAGITAIGLVEDSSGIFQNLSFYGTTSQMYGFYADRVQATMVSNVTAAGTVTSFFGSSTDTGAETYSVNVRIENYNFFGTGAAGPGILLERVGGTILSNSHFWDTAATGSGTAVELANDCQGVTISNMDSEAYGTAIALVQNTVGSTTAAPGWITISNAQLDCAVPATSTPGSCGYTGGNGSTHISIGQGAYFVSIINPTLTGSWAPNGLLAVAGTNTDLPSLRLVGGLVSSSDSPGIVFTGSSSYPVLAASITGTTIQVADNPVGVVGYALGNLVFTGNTILNSSSWSPFGYAGGGSITTGYIAGNFCAEDPTQQCNGGLLPLQSASIGLAGVTAPEASLDTGGAIRTRPAVITLANGSNENVNIGNAGIVRITGPTSSFSIGGFTGGQADGRWLTVFNYADQPMTINNNDSSSSAGNRIGTGQSGNVSVHVAATFYWDVSLNAWLLASYN